MKTRLIVPVFLLLALTCGLAAAQSVRNPKLSPQDLESATKLIRDLGGAGAELTYAARLDLIQKGSFDSLVVVYALPVSSGKDYYAIVSREDKKYPVTTGKKGPLLNPGDKFLRVGLKHQEGSPSLFRIMGAFNDPSRGEMQRNVDFQFNGTEFAFVAKSEMPLPR